MRSFSCFLSRSRCVSQHSSSGSCAGGRSTGSTAVLGSVEMEANRQRLPVEPRCVWFVPVEPRCVWFAPVEPQCVWFAPVEPRCVWFISVEPRCVWFAPVEPRCVWFAPVEPRCVWFVPVEPRCICVVSNNPPLRLLRLSNPSLRSFDKSGRRGVAAAEHSRYLRSYTSDGVEWHLLRVVVSWSSESTGRIIESSTLPLWDGNRDRRTGCWGLPLLHAVSWRASSELSIVLTFLLWDGNRLRRTLTPSAACGGEYIIPWLGSFVTSWLLPRDDLDVAEYLVGVPKDADAVSLRLSQGKPEGIFGPLRSFDWLGSRLDGRSWRSGGLWRTKTRNIKKDGSQLF